MDTIRDILLQNSVGVYSPFIMGILLIIFIQNFFFYFNYKDKAYLWYAAYAITIFLDQIIIIFGDYVNDNYAISTGFLYSSLHPSIQWLYNAAYLIFVLEFGGVFLTAKKSAKRIKQIVYTSIIIMILIFISDLITHSYWVGKVFFLVQMPIFLILAVVVYYYLFKIRSKIKYFLIPGSLVYAVFTLTATVVSMTHKNGLELGWVIFYIGIFIENIFFSLGLIVKQKIILKERNQTQEALIIQLNKNEALQDALNKKLQEEVAQKTSENINLSEIAKTERVKQMEANYEKKLAELKVVALQSQMNPHFIFNSLNSIKLHIIKNNKENAVYYLNKFSKLIRKILASSREKNVSLQEELETAELYINIENIRFKNEIEFKLAIEEGLNLATIKIPPLILQPFIENAIWHGLSLKEGKKELSIEVSKNRNDFVSICISDNGIGRKKASEIKENKVHKKSSIGIQLTEERLASFSKKYKHKHLLSFIDLEKNGQPSGTKVMIDLPFVCA